MFSTNSNRTDGSVEQAVRLNVIRDIAQLLTLVLTAEIDVAREDRTQKKHWDDQYATRGTKRKTPSS
jgi:hypothetical protein